MSALVNVLLKPLPALTVHQGMHNALQLLHRILRKGTRHKDTCCAQSAVHFLVTVIHYKVDTPFNIGSACDSRDVDSNGKLTV